MRQGFVVVSVTHTPFVFIFFAQINDKSRQSKLTAHSLLTLNQSIPFHAIHSPCVVFVCVCACVYHSIHAFHFSAHFEWIWFGVFVSISFDISFRYGMFFRALEIEHSFASALSSPKMNVSIFQFIRWKTILLERNSSEWKNEHNTHTHNLHSFVS